ncbi:hypothetical protein [Algoriphagus sp. Y33]|uniref:hypothetical protein n=1 Tax=Algoriphagus sp. Y33 TaxID=2772483 RepID=UPI001780A3E8|nr:hypothetical protein [Algoriphagus sp. Y33]
METIKIKVSKKILNEVLSLLQQFNKKELQVIENELDKITVFGLMKYEQNFTK